MKTSPHLPRTTVVNGMLICEYLWNMKKKNNGCSVVMGSDTSRRNPLYSQYQRGL